MYPYLLEFTISRHFLSQPARNSRLLHLRFRGKHPRPCAGASAPDQSLRWILLERG